MQTIAAWIVKVISHMGDPNVNRQVSEEVRQMCARFPVPATDC